MMRNIFILSKVLTQYVVTSLIARSFCNQIALLVLQKNIFICLVVSSMYKIYGNKIGVIFRYTIFVDCYSNKNPTSKFQQMYAIHAITHYTISTESF